jgi:single-strand DNA-binding protein
MSQFGRRQRNQNKKIRRKLMFAQVTLIGRLGKDPESRTAGSTEVTTFTVATDYSYKNRDGEWTKKTEWSNVKVWGAQAKSVAQYLKKGSLVAVVGRPETESWDDRESGEKKYKSLVVADRVIFLDSKPSGEKEEPAEKKAKRSAPVAKTTPISDDDIPF